MDNKDAVMTVESSDSLNLVKDTIGARLKTYCEILHRPEGNEDPCPGHEGVQTLITLKLQSIKLRCSLHSHNNITFHLSMIWPCCSY